MLLKPFRPNLHGSGLEFDLESEVLANSGDDALECLECL